MRVNKPAAWAVASALVLSAGCTAQSATGGDSEGSDLSSKTVSFYVYTAPGNEFWSVVERGAKDAAERYGVKLNIQYGNDETVKYNNLIQTATTNNVDALAVSIPDSNAYTNSLCKAHEAGIPVIAYNTNAASGGALDCQMAFIGQDFTEAGYTVGQRMIEEHGITSGDKVFVPVELPEAVWAVQRFAGVKKALDEVGAKADLVGTGVDPAQAQTKLVQYLLGHPDTKAIITLGGTPLGVAPTALKEARVSVPVGGFDLAPDAIKGIEDGVITAAADQQPYSQGYYAVAQLALYLQYKLYPSSMATGGTGLVDKSNVGTVSKLAGTVR